MSAANPMQAVAELERVAVDLGGAAAGDRKVAGDSEAKLLDIGRGGDVGAQVGDAESRAAEKVGVVAVIGSREAVQQVRANGEGVRCRRSPG